MKVLIDRIIYIFKKIISILFKSVGLRLCKIDDFNHIWADKRKYISLIEEVNGCLREILFPKLPFCNGRIKLMAELRGTGVSQAIYIIKFLHESLKLKGDVCEFGVAQGATSVLLANEIRMTKKNLWLFDSFKGLPKPSKKDVLINDIFNLGSIGKYEGTMFCPIDQVNSKLKDISFPPSRVKKIAGFIEETINYKGLPDKVCFAYVDFDFYNPTLIALEFLNKHLSTKGVIVVDDYGWFSSGVETAVDEFLERYKGNYERIFPLKFAGRFCILRKKHNR